ncbi:MAG: cytosine permease [Candidatus Dormibacteraeota bacterium]|uniref:Cytosine permease n=1 Tax=Candidatus Aeolococcus gillhamiae TaxID=3127015 RepID=A0A2W5YXF3_9BACT|nr:cytosine permease [Candidatus Dormibacteraeota bacterium]PZR77480.1 MAG: cytosine permease [Candidatus Dormibacter sp. RRmetagenome_bin12]
MATATDPGTGRRPSGLEVRSIDYVPLRERHGKLWHLGPLWFMSNAQIATLAVGLVSITTGGNVIWSLLAIIAGTLFGTFFMAFHSAQGPQLGLPQMIQSRPQFGYIGALLVWLFAYLQYAGFNVFNTILAGQGMNVTVGGDVKLWIIIATVIAFTVALVGYDLIHSVERLLTYAFVVFFGIFTIVVITKVGLPGNAWDLGQFHVTPFLAQFGVVAGYQISWAIYVSDYSRYLPPGVTVSRTFYWTYGGSALGAIWLMALGTLLAASLATGATFDTIGAIHDAGNKLFSGFGGVILVFSALGLISVTALNMYGGSLTLISAIDSVKRIRPTLLVRIITIGITAGLGLVGALVSSADFLTNFTNFLLLVLYFFIPWTAVNLVDYYIVRRGHYAITEIFKPNGIYGRWGWRGIIAYLVGFAAMIPFFNTGTLYEGFVAKDLSGADISIFIGLPIAGILYFLLSRSIDTANERAVAARADVNLEQLAVAHARD